jgi:hypothetical protein
MATNGKNHGSQKTSTNSADVLPISMPRATHRGELFLGGIKAPCFVLPDETALISKRGVIALISGGAETGNLGQYIHRIPNKPEGFQLGTIVLRDTDGRAIVHGHSAAQVAMVLQLYAAALINGQLKKSQLEIGRRCATIALALAAEGLTKKIYDATGFIQDRVVREFNLKVQLSLLSEATNWERTFDEVFYAGANRMNNRAELGSKPVMSPAFYRKYVYDFLLGEDVADELKRRNPNPRFGSNHHQYLTEPQKKLLREHLGTVVTLFDTSEDFEDFKNRFDHKFRKMPLQLSLRVRKN